jgi:hypothetical protein
MLLHPLEYLLGKSLGGNGKYLLLEYPVYIITVVLFGHFLYFRNQTRPFSEWQKVSLKNLYEKITLEQN